MSHDHGLLQRSISPASSTGRASPSQTLARRSEATPKQDKAQRKYAAGIEKALASFDPSQQQWADYIAFLGRLLKAVQAQKDVSRIPHSPLMSLRLAQCLNPTLPSGVHQKALEVYLYIFATLGTNLGHEIHVFLPGLLPLLSFASLTVRPLFYDLFEQFVLKVGADELHPIVKSLILSLLPGIEDETSEDFDRGVDMLDKLRRAVRVPNDSEDDSSESSQQPAYFWQCLFLAVMTSEGRRQGALIYLNRRLPSFHSISLSEDVRDEVATILRPEPGLLVRCFASGLQDTNILVQRGFLDLLVTHLPIKSDLFQKVVEPADLDLLVSAASSVVLRRDMSLNRRLWAWFLGPEGANGEASHEDTEIRSPDALSDDQSSSRQVKHFQQYGALSLQRCILEMFKSDEPITGDRTRPFRICAALMDKWEIGGVFSPSTFLPAMRSVFAIARTSDTVISADVVKSASILFDGIESTLIWSQLTTLVRTSFRNAATQLRQSVYDLELIFYVINTFNIREEDMLQRHIPDFLLVILGQISTDDWAAEPFVHDLSPLLFDTIERLTSLLPSHTLASQDLYPADSKREPALSVLNAAHKDLSDESAISRLSSHRLVDADATLFTSALSHNSMRAYTARTADILVGQLGRSSSDSRRFLGVIIDSITQYLSATADFSLGNEPDFASIAAISKVWMCIAEEISDIAEASENAGFITNGISKALWYSLGPQTPKYHVESVALLWHLSQFTEASTCSLDLCAFLCIELQNKSEACFSRFMTFWDLTLHGNTSKSGRKASQVSRRGSAFTSVHEIAPKTVEQILQRPLLLSLDALKSPISGLGIFVASWLRTLPSLDRVLSMLLNLAEKSAKSAKPINDKHDIAGRGRTAIDGISSLRVTMAHLVEVLAQGSDHTWDVFAELRSSAEGSEHQPFTGIQFIANFALHQLEDTSSSQFPEFHRLNLRLVSMLFDSKYSSSLKELLFGDQLVALLRGELRSGTPLQQLEYLRIIPKSIRLMQTDVENKPIMTSKGSGSMRRLPTLQFPSAPDVPQGLFECIKEAMTTPLAQINLEHWIEFLEEVLPLAEQGLMSALITLVECICKQIDTIFSGIRSMSSGPIRSTGQELVSSLPLLLRGLELVVASAHRLVLREAAEALSAKPPPSPHGLFSGGIAAVVASPGNQSNVPVKSNSRLTVILCIHDAVEICFRLWAWGSNTGELDPTSAATSSFNAQKIRNRSRKMLENLFAAEGLESLETLIWMWVKAAQDGWHGLEPASTFNLLNVLSGTRPGIALPLLLNTIYSRTNIESLDAVRRSTLTKELSALETTSFLLKYVASIEDDALDEIWGDCNVFLRDVLSNPMPHRLILPPLLEFVALVAGKLDNTNFGDTTKMHRELSDIFSRLLTAVFTVRPSSMALTETTVDSSISDGNLTTSLIRVIPQLHSVLENSDRIMTSCNNITMYVIAPIFRAKAFPETVKPEILDLLLAISVQTPEAKLWKKEISDAFNDARIFATSAEVMQRHWFVVLAKWSRTEVNLIPDILLRIAAPSAAGLMFGVGASSARLAADRHTQQNLRRVALLLLANEKDLLVTSVPAIGEKLSELCAATLTSSPSSATRAEVFMVWRALFISTSHVHMASMWPLINTVLQAALLSASPHEAQQDMHSNLSLLQACKLLDLLATIQPDEFQLLEWVFLTNTIDAVYAHGRRSTAIADEVAEVLSTRNGANANTTAASSHDTVARLDVSKPGEPRRPMLCRLGLDSADVKVLAREDFVQQTLLPFFSGLSINAYEQRYQMAGVDWEACRLDLIGDLMDERTVA